MGCGPFKFVEGSIDERIVLERFEDYYGGSPEIPPVGPAPAKRVIFEFMPEVSTRVAALQGGDVHIIHAIPPDMVATLESDPNIEVKTVDGTRMHMFEMNVNMAPFDDVRVRQALNYAIDMEAIVENVLLGYGTAVSGPLLPHGFAVHPELQPYGYDPDKARELLAEAGYAGGFELVIDTSDELKDVVYAAASMLTEVGIDATVRTWDWAVLIEQLLAGERMMLRNWGNSTLIRAICFTETEKQRSRQLFRVCQPRSGRTAQCRRDRDRRRAGPNLLRSPGDYLQRCSWYSALWGREIEACRSNVVNWSPTRTAALTCTG